jgi:hypothetical protein
VWEHLFVNADTHISPREGGFAGTRISVEWLYFIPQIEAIRDRRAVVFPNARERKEV